MKLGYSTHTSVTPSETFIYDLIMAFSKDKDIELTIFGGKKNHRIDGLGNIKTISTGYAEKGYQHSFRLYKVGQILGGKGNLFKNAYQKKTAYKCLSKKITLADRPDIAYIDYGTSAVLCYEFLKRYNIPFVVHVHGYDVTSALNDNVYKMELNEVFLNAEFIIAASQYIRKILIMAGCPDEKIKVIRYGIDDANIVPLKWEERKKSQPSIIFLGRLTSKKHPIALLHAFYLVQKEIPQCKLTIIGGGELENEVMDEIYKLGISEKVNMLGVLNRKESFPILNSHWIYAQHSVTANSGDQEGFAISLAEAALHEIPVVSTYHNGIPENVIDGKTGLLVKEFDFEEMAEKILYLINNPIVSEKMGKAGRKHIKELCEPQKRITAIKTLLFESIKKQA